MSETSEDAFKASAYLCPDCGKPMTLATGIDYFCQTPECTKKARAQFAADLRQSYQESEGWKTRDDLFAELQEARMRIGGLEAELREVQSKSYNQYKCGFAHGCHQFRHDMAEAGHAEVANTISADLIEHYARDASENFHAKDARIAALEAALSPISGITLGDDLVGKITEQEAIDLINATLSARRQVANGTAKKGAPDA